MEEWNIIHEISMLYAPLETFRGVVDIMSWLKIIIIISFMFIFTLWNVIEIKAVEIKLENLIEYYKNQKNTFHKCKLKNF